jgi:hypothetical protein
LPCCAKRREILQISRDFSPQLRLNREEKTTMSTNQRDTTGEDELTSDPVWDLLRKSASTMANPSFANPSFANPSFANPSFADRVLRAVRQQEKPQTLLQRLFAPPALSYSLTGLATAAAALALAAVFFVKPHVNSGTAKSKIPSIDEFADLDEVASQEMLSAATDHLNEFSDTELVSLIGF